MWKLKNYPEIGELTKEDVDVVSLVFSNFDFYRNSNGSIIACMQGSLDSLARVEKEDPDVVHSLRGLVLTYKKLSVKELVSCKQVPLHYVITYNTVELPHYCGPLLGAIGRVHLSLVKVPKLYWKDIEEKFASKPADSGFKGIPDPNMLKNLLFSGILPENGNQGYVHALYVDCSKGAPTGLSGYLESLWSSRIPWCVIEAEYEKFTLLDVMCIYNGGQSSFNGEKESGYLGEVGNLFGYIDEYLKSEH